MKQKKASIKNAGKDASGALTTLSKGVVDGASAFLSRICLPAAEEFGYLLKDKVHNYRANNILSITKEAENILAKHTGKLLHAHPRLVAEIMDHGSWSDDDAIQKKWAGLLISSCDETGRDDSNLIFVDLLRQLSTVEVRILDYTCQVSNKKIIHSNILTCNELIITGKTLKEVSGIDDVHRLQRELAHSKTLGLLVDGLISDEGPHQIEHSFMERDESNRTREKRVANVASYTWAVATLTDFAFHLYVRSKGYSGSPAEYYFGKDYLDKNIEIVET